MTKQTHRLSGDKFDIEFIKSDNEYRLWLNNKSINEHVSIMLSKQDLDELKHMLNWGI